MRKFSWNGQRKNFPESVRGFKWKSEINRDSDSALTVFASISRSKDNKNLNRFLNCRSTDNFSKSRNVQHAIVRLNGTKNN
jgi:hypothetical protein